MNSLFANPHGSQAEHAAEAGNAADKDGENAGDTHLLACSFLGIVLGLFWEVGWMGPLGPALEGTYREKPRGIGEWRSQ